MRILLWAPLGAGNHYWGPGTNIYRLYKCLKDENISVTLVHGSSEQGDYPDVFDKQITLPFYDKGGWISKMLYFYKGRRWLKRNYQDYDVFHGISAYQTTFYFARLFYGFNKPSLIKVTGELGGFGDSGIVSKLLGISKWRLTNANSISGYIAISKVIEDNLNNIGVDSSKIISIPNGVDTERFINKGGETRQKLFDKYEINNKMTISYVGGLTLNKRVLELVEAVKRLLDEGFDIQLLLVGPDRSGSDKVQEKLISYVKANSLENFIHHFDHTFCPEEFYQMSDIYVLNSKSEGMPNSLLEAMSSSLCCVVTPVSGSVDLIENGVNGLHVDGSVADLVEKLSVVCKNVTLRNEFSIAARKTIEDKFSSEIVLAKHIEVFKKLVNDK